MPVISCCFGEYGAFALICGYEDNGRYLHGAIQDSSVPPEINQYVRYENGLDTPDGLIFIGEKTHTPLLAESLRKATRNNPRAGFPPRQ